MRALFCVIFAIHTTAYNGVAEALPPDGLHRIGSDEDLFPYQFEKGNLHYADVLTLANGSKSTGKVLEWADRILLFDAMGKITAKPLADVRLFETRREARHRQKPSLPDLTVAYVERLPRDPSWHGHLLPGDRTGRLDLDPGNVAWTPADGSQVTFRVHVLNAGSMPSSEVPWRALIGGKEEASGSLPSLAPGKESAVDVSWHWQQGRQRLRFEIDPEQASQDSLRWNNVFTEPVHALAVTVVVARDRYQAFRKTPNLLDSFCFEDYIQYHLRNLNALFAASVYPSAPQGSIERVRCDRILIVDDPSDVATRPQWRNVLRRGGRADGLAEYAALLTLGTLSKQEDPLYDALKVDWSLLQQVCQQLGLVDLRKTDTTLEQCYVLDKNGRFAQRRFISSDFRTLMYAAGGFPLTEPQACFLNRALSRPRGLQGEYLCQVPEKIVLEILANDGTPREGVQIDAFQRISEGEDAGKIIGIGRTDPLFSTFSDAAGRAPLANLPAGPLETPAGYALQPNPFGQIAADGSNGLLLLRLRLERAEEFHFLPLSVCNVAYLRGHREEYVHRIQTRMGPTGAPPPPPHTAARMTDRSVDQPPLKVTWFLPPDYDPSVIKEFRIYKRTSFAGDTVKPWTLVSIKKSKPGHWIRQSEETYFDEFRYDGPYSLDTFFATTSVDNQGRESSLSERAYVAYGKDSVQFAIDGNAAYVTVSGDGPAQMLYWDGIAGTQPFALKVDKFPGYRPAFAGIAFTPDHRLIVTDPRNHVLAIYDKERQELLDVIPKRETWPGAPGSNPGEFSDPADVAVDDNGNVYVADRGNHRVQMLDPSGTFIGLIDEDYRFEAPDAVGYANGHLCVTDKRRTRCRVYELNGGQAEFVCELPPLLDAGRGLVDATNRVFVTGRTSADDKWAVQVFTPYGRTAVFAEARARGVMGQYYKPRGLYRYGNVEGGFAYFVNQFPFDVRRVALGQ